MKRHQSISVWMAAVSVTMGIYGCAHAESYSFVEPFNSPPLTAGTDPNFYQDGWNNGDNGWIVSEAGAAPWGQRTGVSSFWPGGTDNSLGTIRHQDFSADSFVARSFGQLAQTPKPLGSGNISLKMQNILIYGSQTELTLYDAEERTPALTLKFGESGINQNKLEVSQIGGAGTVVTTAASNLPWSTNGFSSASGHYGVLSIDFNAASDQATVTVSSVNAAGAVTSATPVVVPFTKAVSAIGQVRLTSKASPNAGQPGSLLWLGELGINGQVTDPGPSTFGKNWSRSHEFQIMGAALGASPQLSLSDYMDAGLTTVFANNNYDVAYAAAEGGKSWMMHLGPPRPYTAYTPGHHIEINNVIDYGLTRGKAIGWMLPDEPVTQAEIEGLRDSSLWFKRNHPDLPVMVSVFQKDAPTLNNIIGTIKPDIVIFDFYPFRNDGSTEQNQWFETLMAVRTAAKAANIPYWGWMQSFQTAAYFNRVPSESDVRYNAFSLLTAGYTGLNYFSYDHDTGGSMESTFFDTNGNKTPFYFYTATMNAEVKRIGKSLRYLDSSDVRFVRGANVSTPTGLTDWAQGAGANTKIQAIAVSGTPTVGKDALVGFFNDDAGKQYFMLTNLYQGAGASAAAKSASFTVTFDSSVNALVRVNRQTGEPERVDLTNHILNLTLPGGTGDLFKYHDGGAIAGILMGDANLDDAVDSLDFNTLIANYGGQNKRWSQADFDLNDKVNTNDFNFLAGSFGGTLASATPSLGAVVPEPSSLSVGVIVVAAALRRVGRRARMFM